MIIKTTANSFGHIALSTVGAVSTLILVFWIVVAVQTGIHGNGAFGHDAGADFAPRTLGSVFAIPATLLAFGLRFDSVAEVLSYFGTTVPTGIPQLP